MRPRLTAATQAVVINLCLADGAAMMMGIENFVCEVQLVLSAFAPLLEVKTDFNPGHLSFVSHGLWLNET